MKFKVLCCVILLSGFTFAQLGFEIEEGTVVRPDTTFISPTETLYLQTNREDVKAIGMGKTQVANGKHFNAMLYNPALLSRKRFTIDAISVGLSMPPKTYDAANYLKGHMNEFELMQNYPNPFNPVTNIKFRTAEAGIVKLFVYDALGQKVTELLNKEMAAGEYSVPFSSSVITLQNGSDLPSGVYYYQLVINGKTQSKKMILVK